MGFLLVTEKDLKKLEENKHSGMCVVIVDAGMPEKVLQRTFRFIWTIVMSQGEKEK